MLYPRLDKDGKLVTEEQMVGYREHLLLEHRMIFMSGQITSETESHNLLMALDSLSCSPIKVVITSGGGDLDSAFLFYDTIRLIKAPIITLGRYCASAAAMILAAGEERYLMPHAKVMLHLPYGQATGDAHDWQIQGREMQKYMTKMVDIFLECGARKSHLQIVSDIDRDLWLEPEEAIEYGLADKIIDKETLGGWLT